MTIDETPADISVVICCYTEKRMDDLLALIASLYAQTLQPREIIVVVDHNHGLFQKIQAAFLGITVLENQEAQGASGARNSGVAAASGEIIAFIDDDAQADPDWLAQLYTVYQDEKVIGVGGHIRPLWAGENPRWFPKEFYWVIGSSYTGMPTQTAPIRNLWTVNMSVRRSAFHAIQGFRTGFGKVGSRSSPEDTDLCIRLIQMFPQGVLLYLPDARVQHKVTPERATFRYFVWRCFNEGQGKAHLSNLVGQDQGISSERSHLLNVIPRGFFHELSAALFHRDPSGLARAGAIMIGLSATVLGYAWGMVVLTSGSFKNKRNRWTFNG